MSTRIIVTWKKSLLWILITIGLSLGMGVAPLWAQEEHSINDQDITYAIETEFMLDEEVEAHLIDVSTADGVVTLSGSVNNVLAKVRAKELAETVKGVRSVINTIEVNAVKRSDDAIKADVDKALLADPAAESYEITTTVDNRTVTVDGTVESWQEMQLAENVVRGVKGVREIVNNLDIVYKDSHTDREIETEIERRLEEDVWVDAELIDVSVEDGKVTLSGSIGSAAERRRARADAWVAGTESVDVEDLNVEWWVKDEMEREKPVVSRPSNVVEQAVQDAFLYDPRVYSFDLEVKVRDGKAILSGVVSNMKAKQAAETDARNTRGVWTVENHIRVRPDSLPANSVLEERVRDALLRDPFTELFEIDVRAVNGKVYLNGTVNTSFERDRAEDIAWRVKGVIEVENQLDYEHSWTKKKDWEIRDDVRDQIFWSPYVDRADVQVRVENGIVILTGEVDSWSEWHAAEDNAYEGGAKDVRNELTLSDGFEYDYPYPFMAR
jgi:osmotically-inducible protein OsmY